MNRDELLEACFGEAELAVPQHWFGRLPDVGDGRTLDPTYQGHVLSLVGLGYRRVLVRNSVAPGSGIAATWTTIQVAAIMNVCTDPDHRGKGYASEQMVAALDAARSHALTPFAALFASGVPKFHERFGFHFPKFASPPGFMVCELGLDPWPDGEVMTHGRW